MKNNKKVSTVKTPGGTFNLAGGHLPLGAIDFPIVQKAISALPNSKEKTTIAYGFASYYGAEKSREWLNGITGVTHDKA